ncbi:cell division protein FtsQ/DivIB [Raineyella fluvialis]|uniref:FtsQ-type POTRA domain-containing protein n=1 Tax=Raineyella fluvialis TaxID=2662261 RepID=A0A5Q2FIP6_9ACTN|nr:FtsQ-type POTRA domain-containing protein [Raineyella fluvialis]QGF24236.1 FtsQ-type POTRA domain-containing protein [Raineyella fluvialis]
MGRRVPPPAQAREGAGASAEPGSRRARERRAVPRDGVADLSGPIRLRRERALRRQRRRLAVALVISVLVAVAVWLLALSPVFATRAVDVQGTSLLTPDQVIAAAQVPDSVPLVRQDTTEIATRVRSLAPVRDVTVLRSWPHTISLQITERSPVVAFPVNGTYVLVDAEGRAYAQVGDAPKDVLQAQGNPGDSAVTSAVGRTVATLPAAIRAQVRSVRADSAAAVTLELDKGRTVVWGGPEDPQLKGQVLTVLLKQVDGAKVYDVSAPAFPTTR